MGHGASKPPIPVDRLVEQVCDAGGDYNDDVMGNASGTYSDGVLTLTFKRDLESEADDGNDWGDATYRFRLIPEPDAPTPLGDIQDT